MNFLLSICIPTRDRVDSIKDNIDHLIAEIQENKLQNIIQVIISDNSHDLNESLKNKSSIFNFLTYVHSQDLGHDYNILNLSKNSNSKYLWFCQDHTKIRFENINFIINTLKNKNPNYIYLPTKDNLVYEKLIEKDNRYISFKNVYLNTNLIKKELFDKYYGKLLKNFNGSHLVFQHAIIYVNFNADENKIKIFNKKYSDYKFFVNKSYNRNTWSRSLKNYLSILEICSLMFQDIKKISSLDLQKVRHIYSKNSHGFALLYQLTLLQRLDQKFDFKDPYISQISSHLTFNNLTIIYLKIILKKKFNFNVFSKFFIIELSYLLFSPKNFLERFFSKIRNSFS